MAKKNGLTHKELKNDKEKGDVCNNKHNTKFYCNCGNGSIFDNDQQHIKCHKHKSAENVVMYDINTTNYLTSEQKKKIDLFLKSSKSSRYEDYVKSLCENGSNRKNIITDIKYNEYLKTKIHS